MGKYKKRDERNREGAWPPFGTFFPETKAENHGKRPEKFIKSAKRGGRRILKYSKIPNKYLVLNEMSGDVHIYVDRGFLFDSIAFLFGFLFGAVGVCFSTLVLQHLLLV